jgi:hypothetical protein
METLARRSEDRVPIALRVDLCSLDIRHRAHEGVTENISSHGARVVCSKPWKPNDRLNLRSLLGDLRARARVVYCEPRETGSYVIGLQLLATTGKWK